MWKKVLVAVSAGVVLASWSVAQEGIEPGQGVDLAARESPPPGPPGEAGPSDGPPFPPPGVEGPPFPPPPGPDPDPLINMIGRHRPQLARRLAHLRARDPKAFHRVITEAFVVRIEQALNEIEPGGGERMPPRPESHPGPVDAGKEPGGELGPPPGFGPPGAAGRPRPDARMRELREQHERLEAQAHELARQYQEVREQAGAVERCERLRGELEEVTRAQFELRGRIRRAELEGLEREIGQLQRRLERMRADLEMREREQGPIIQRRVEQLLGEDSGGW